MKKKRMREMNVGRVWVRAAVGVVSALFATTVEAVSIDRLWSNTYGRFEIFGGKSGAVYGYDNGLYQLDLQTGSRTSLSTRTELDAKARTMLVKEGLHPYLLQGSYVIGKPLLVLGRAFNLIWDTDRRKLAVIQVSNSSRSYLQEFAPHSSTLLGEAPLDLASYDFMEIVGNPDSGRFALSWSRYGMVFESHGAAFFGTRLQDYRVPFNVAYSFDRRGILGASEKPGSRRDNGSQNPPGQLALFDPIREKAVWRRKDLDIGEWIGSLIVARSEFGPWLVLDPSNGKTLAKMPESFQRYSYRTWVFGNIIIGAGRDNKGVDRQVAFRIRR